MSRTRRSSELRERYWGIPVPEGLVHRPNSYAYQIYGCGCGLCLPSGRRHVTRQGNPVREPRVPKTANQRNKELRERKYGTPVPDTVKHGVYARRIYGCTCDTCRTSRRKENHKARNPWMYRNTRGVWTIDGDRTILCWPPANAGPDWKCPHEEAS